MSLSVCPKRIIAARSWFAMMARGLVEPPNDHPGMGLQIMKYRADMICGTLELRSEKAHGTSVTCKFPLEHKVAGGNVEFSFPRHGA